MLEFVDFSIKPCPEFGENHVKVVDKHTIEKYTFIHGLEGHFGKIIDMKQSWKNFSKLDLGYFAHILLGPISLENHSCDENTQFTRRRYDDSSVAIKTLRTIRKGDAISKIYQTG